MLKKTALSIVIVLVGAWSVNLLAEVKGRKTLAKSDAEKKILAVLLVQ